MTPFIHNKEFRARSKATQCKLYWHAQHSNSRQKIFRIKIKGDAASYMDSRKLEVRSFHTIRIFFANFEKGQKLVNNSFSGKRKENFPSKCIGFSEKKE